MDIDLQSVKYRLTTVFAILDVIVQYLEIKFQSVIRILFHSVEIVAILPHNIYHVSFVLDFFPVFTIMSI